MRKNFDKLLQSFTALHVTHALINLMEHALKATDKL